MTTESDVEVLAALRREVVLLEKEIARGKYETLADFASVQGRLFGLDQAILIIHKALADIEDKLDN